VELSFFFYILLFIVAFLYASVGHGGASGYLALMALFNMDPGIMKPTALLLNLFVSLTAFIQFYRGGHFKWKIFLPFAVASVPMSFIGGLVSLDVFVYKKILGLLLLIPVARFLFSPKSHSDQLEEPKIWMSVLIGVLIGFLSGLIGIGGGIILSPVLLLMGWTNQKQTAAISALFIFVNSLAGLGGQMAKGVSFDASMLSMVGIAFIGGLFGAWLGALKFNQRVLQYSLAVVLALASFKLLFTGA
jgi:uncharacterized protein